METMHKKIREGNGIGGKEKNYRERERERENWGRGWLKKRKK